ncbi:MAG: 2Fe-2S iron-sulfur cluster-binding protein [Candidatus Bipolaricaulia bacterium]
MKVTIDGTEVRVPEGKTILEAAEQAGIYIPHLCAHPDLPPVEGLKPAEAVYRGGERIDNNPAFEEYGGCQLCMVEVEGMRDLQRACNTPVAEGMIVHTATARVGEFRRGRLASLLAKHPHACLTCAQREGCAREPCSMDIPIEERCCVKFGYCELQSVAEYIGIKEDTPRYRFEDLPVMKDEPLFDLNYNLCIGCTRCVRVCRDLRDVGALGFVFDEEGRVIVGMIGPTLKESGCKFCTACVAVCPTGALLDKDPDKGRERRKLLEIEFTPPLQPPGQWSALTRHNLEAVPEREGVYQLLDEDQNIIYIAGTMNLRQALREQLANERAHYFGYEEEPMYTMRESELLQRYLQEHGRMPELNDELADLF